VSVINLKKIIIINRLITCQELREFLVSCGFTHVRGIGPHAVKFQAADDTHFEF
jgi:hypothetical protein